MSMTRISIHVPREGHDAILKYLGSRSIPNFYPRAP